MSATLSSLATIAGVAGAVAVVMAFGYLLEHLLRRGDCRYCSGRGTYFGYSPLDSLATFRHARTLPCGRCRGTGREPNPRPTRTINT